MPTPASVDEYVAGLPDDRRAGIDVLRATVNAAAPEATETIAYQMPALRVDGRFLVSYAAFRQHYSLFPASDGVVRTLGEAVAPYLAGKGTIRFPASRPIPVALVTKIIEIRLAEHADDPGR